jgi:hypothetical protein
LIAVEDPLFLERYAADREGSNRVVGGNSFRYYNRDKILPRYERDNAASPDLAVILYIAELVLQ